MKNESAVLKRLGPVPFWRGERKCLDVLGDIYRRAMDAAQDRRQKISKFTPLTATGRK